MRQWSSSESDVAAYFQVLFETIQPLTFKNQQILQKL